MRKLTFGVLIVCLLLLVTRCIEAIYEDSKGVTGNSAEFEFMLGLSLPSYEVQLQVRYSYGLGHSLDKLTREIISPSGKKYTDWTLLSAEKANQVRSGLKTLHFQNVQQEEGTFKLTIQKEPGKIKLKKATLKVYPIE